MEGNHPRGERIRELHARRNQLHVVLDRLRRSHPWPRRAPRQDEVEQQLAAIEIELARLESR